MSDTVTKRLHIGGLTPNITPTHLRDRFKIFGQVEEVEQLQPDALGQPRPFAYLTMQITPAQLKRCMNILSGSMYRGTQLRIAEAKPRFSERLATEGKPPARQIEKEQVNKRKRARREMGPEVGKEAQDMGVATEENYKRSKFWKVADDHLIRPLAIRPTHPLPPPVVQPAQPAKKESKAGPSKPVKRNPPNRQRRRVIDPSLWQPTYLSGAILDVGSDGRETDGEWVFEEVDEDELEADVGQEGSEDEVVLGVWRKIGGDADEAEQVVRVKRQRVALDAGEEEEEGAEYDWGVTNGERGDSPLFGDRADSPLFGSRDGGAEGGKTSLFGDREAEGGEEAEERESSPLFGTRPDAFPASDGQSGSDRSESPFFASRPAKVEMSEAVEAVEVEGELSDAAPTGSYDADIEVNVTTAAPSSPLFTARPVLIDDTEIITEITTTTSAPTPPLAQVTAAPAIPSLPAALVHQAKSETSLSLSVLSSLLASRPDAPFIPTKPGKDEWRGFAESDSEDELEGEDIFQGRNVASEGVLRLRGGAPDGVEDEDAGEGDDDVDSDDEDAASVASSEAPSSSGSDISSDSSSSSSDSSSSSSSTSSSSSSPSSSSSSSDADSDSAASSSPTKPAPKLNALRGFFGSRPIPASSSSTVAPAATAGGFSLSALYGADIEMDDELDIPLAPRSSDAQRPELELLAQAPRQVFDDSADIPLFFAPGPAPKGGRGMESRPGWAKHPITIQREAAAAEVAGPSSSGFGGMGGAGDEVAADGTGEKVESSAGFWRKESDESMRHRWDRVKGELTSEWKRRGREARKQRKRRGGGGDDE